MSTLADLALPLISGSSLAVLGLLALRAHIATRAAARSSASLQCERFLGEATESLLEASRRSSAAVFAALDRSLRSVEPCIDSVLVFVPAGADLACAYASGTRGEHFAHSALRRDDSRALPSKAAQTGCRAMLPLDGAALMPTDRAAIAVPLVDSRRVVATVYVSTSQTTAFAYADALVRAIERASIPYAIALEREADRSDATHDGLTGLLAPRAFRRRLHDEVARVESAARRELLSLWFVDTDSFKSINDRFGHRAGDAVLVAMAALLRAHLVPDVDVAARNGGDEFCALIRGATKSSAIERARGFCDAVRTHDFGLQAGVTASVGVATYPYDATTSNLLLEAADAAMYRSKRNGRDRVSWAEAETGTPRSTSRWRSSIGESCVQSSP